MDSLSEKVVTAIAKMQKRSPEEIALDSTFEELGIDSLNGFHLLVELEEELGITIPDDDARQLVRVCDVVEVIRPLVLAK
ncbi:MAG TPA: phosphopantetheine-binding protein [Vicinamibacteria bacterium]|nr:phosphopantetheine-binding protein [Vicinamibacteria bacterium]